jgi:hypothetical protein
MPYAPCENASERRALTRISRAVRRFAKAFEPYASQISCRPCILYIGSFS